MPTTKWWVRDRNPEPAEVEEPKVDLEALTKPELAAMAEAKGTDPSGTKAELVERLSE